MLYTIFMETNATQMPAWMTAEDAADASLSVDLGDRKASACWPAFKARAVAALVAAGAKVTRNESAGGSVYLTLNGKKIRVSDHDVPATAERRHECRFRGGADEEYVVRASRILSDKSPEAFAAWLIECESCE